MCGTQGPNFSVLRECGPIYFYQSNHQAQTGKEQGIQIGLKGGLGMGNEGLHKFIML